MKKIFFLLLLLPILSFGQRNPLATTMGDVKNGQVARIYADTGAKYPAVKDKDGRWVQGDTKYTGNVIFDIGANKIYCDSAIEHGNAIYFYNVKVACKSLPAMKGDHLIFDQQNKTAKITGNVSIDRKNNDVIIANNAELDFTKEEYEIAKLN